MTNLEARIAEAMKPKTRVKRVPSRPDTIGWVACEMIRAKMVEDHVWTKDDTYDVIEAVFKWCDEKGQVTKFQASHVAYYRTVLKNAK